MLSQFVRTSKRFCADEQSDAKGRISHCTTSRSASAFCASFIFKPPAFPPVPTIGMFPHFYFFRQPAASLWADGVDFWPIAPTLTISDVPGGASNNSSSFRAAALLPAITGYTPLLHPFIRPRRAGFHPLPRRKLLPQRLARPGRALIKNRRQNTPPRTRGRAGFIDRGPD